MENFELRLKGQRSTLLIGKNGSGKSTVGFALEVLQKIARGANRVEDLVKPKQLALGRSDSPVRVEIEADLSLYICRYSLALELPRTVGEDARSISVHFSNDQGSDENPLLLHRKSHLEPTVVRRLSELNIKWDRVSALTRGDVPWASTACIRID